MDVLEEGWAVTFVQNLQKHGWWVILWTSTSCSTIQRYTPGLAEMVDSFRGKSTLGYEILEHFQDCLESDVDTIEVVVLDDDQEIGQGMVDSFNQCKAGIARYLPAKDWKTLFVY